MQLKLTRTFEAEELEKDSPLVAFHGVRLTVREATVRRMGEQSERLREARAAWLRYCGVEEEGLKEFKPTDQQLIVRSAFVAWAKASAVTTLVEVSTLVDDKVEWRESSLKELGLDVPDGVLDLPSSLLDSWTSTSDYVNAGVDGIAETAELKKSAMSSVT
jgi:hypothetical protein